VQAAPWQVGIQFFQVGDDEQARQNLQKLDNELVKRRSYGGIRDIVDTVPWCGDRGNVNTAAYRGNSRCCAAPTAAPTTRTGSGYSTYAPSSKAEN
jgi:hypothetical protein